MKKNLYKKFLSDYLNKDPFSLDLEKKEKLLFYGLNLLNKHHSENNNIYNKIFNKYLVSHKPRKLEDLPYLPVTIFKELDFYSTTLNKITKIAMSSGTTGSNLSKIYLDMENSINQFKVLKKILESFFGKKKFPLCLLSAPVDKKLKNINAKIAGINGFSSIASQTFFIINEDGLNNSTLDDFLKIKGKKFFFGFTHDIWKHLVVNKLKYNFNETILIHGGGWKKMENLKISEQKFKNHLIKKFNFKDVINYYGMIEQTGSIFFKCSTCDLFITSIFSDIIIRDNDFRSIIGKEGLVQLISILPSSYPGHNILTQDIGIIKKKNCSKCKDKKGKRFKILGRVKNSEIRGCSNI